jgi:hypothetical protein
LQQFAGGFVLNGELARVGGAKLEQLEAAMSGEQATTLLAPASGDVAQQLWAIAVALALFETRFAASSDAWSMVAEKARSLALSLFAQAGLADRKQARLRLSQLIDAAKAAL